MSTNVEQTETSEQKGSGGERKQLLRLVRQLIGQSHHGESAVIAVGALMGMFKSRYKASYHITLHRFTSKDAPSNQINDVDVYEDGELLRTLFVKDKFFTPEDVEQAVKNTQAAKHPHLIFVKGPQGQLKRCSVSEMDLSHQYARAGFDLSFVHLYEFAETLVAMAPQNYLAHFLESLQNSLEQALVQTETREHVQECLRSLGWDKK